MKEQSCIPKCKIAGTSPSDCLVSHAGHSLEGVLSLGRKAVGVFYSLSRLCKFPVLYFFCVNLLHSRFFPSFFFFFQWKFSLSDIFHGQYIMAIPGPGV